MSDNDSSPTNTVSEGGVTALHAPRSQDPLRVAPSLAGEFNQLGLDLVPVACLSLTDFVFAFDSSFVTPEAACVLSKLPGLRDACKGATGQLPPLSVFGHADPTGKDDYNKTLSGRRAKAVYGLLTHNSSIWQDLYNQPFGGDNWPAKRVAATMSAATSKPDGTAFSTMLEAYMKLLCPSSVDASDFLAQGADSLGKGDYQGCSDFNPLILLSKQDLETLSDEDRNGRYSPDRRVVVYLFRPGTTVKANLWPCPRSNESSAGCYARFFSNGDTRRKPGDIQREHTALQGTAGDTFACRFYARIGGCSPCEKPIPVQPLIIRLFDPFTVRAASSPYRVTVGGQVFNKQADDDGFLRINLAGKPQDCQLEWGTGEQEGTYLYSMKIYLDMTGLDQDEEVKRRLHNLGYMEDSLPDNVTAFQRDFGFDLTGQPGDVLSTLRNWHNDPTLIPQRPESGGATA